MPYCDKPWPLSPTTEVWSRHFSASESVYVDHWGRRVLGDMEGMGLCVVCGKAQIFNADGSLLSEDPRPLVPFEDGVVVVADPAEPVVVQIFKGIELGSYLDAAQFVDSGFRGCGWFLGSENGCSLDGDNENHKSFAPFFSSIEGAGWFVPILDQRSQVIDVFDVTDECQTRERNWTVRNVSDTFELKSSFANGRILVGRHLSHLNTARWVVNLPLNNSGVRLRKLYDRFHGRQRARVLVDGHFSGWWYQAEEDRTNRWAWSNYGIPIEHTQGKTSIVLSIDPPPASPLWSVSRYEVLALLPAS